MVLGYDNYKRYLRDWMDKQTHGGRGEVARLAEFLNVSPSLISTILNSDRHFSVEQACELTEHLSIAGIEADYFVALVSFEKAGSEKLRKYWSQQKRKILTESEQLKQRIKHEKRLTHEEQNLYYSQSLYSQIRVLSTLDHGVSLGDLHHAIKLPPAKIQEAVTFLLQTGLIEEKNQRYFATNQMIHINKESTNYLRNHMNWRLQQLQQVVSVDNTDLTYTFACTLNRTDFERIKKMLTDAITESHKIVRESPAEEMACLTIDFISHFRPNRG